MAAHLPIPVLTSLQDVFQDSATAADQGLESIHMHNL